MKATSSPVSITGPFALVANDCPVVLVAPAVCKLTVRFDPPSPAPQRLVSEPGAIDHHGVLTMSLFPAPLRVSLRGQQMRSPLPLAVPEFRVLLKQRLAYDAIVRQLRDPALLEYVRKRLRQSL